MKNELKVGALAVIGIIILILGYNYLKGKKVFSTQHTYYAEYDNVSGLLEGNPVSINGLNVGVVESRYFKPDRSGKIIVSMLVDKTAQIPMDSELNIKSSVLGDTGVEITLGESPELAQSGDTLIGITPTDMLTSVTEQVAPITRKLDTLLLSLDTTLTEVNAFLKAAKLAETVNNLNATIIEAKGMVANANGLVNNINDFTQTDLKKVGGILDKAGQSLNNVQDLTNSLKVQTSKIGKVLDNTEKATAKLAALEIAETLDNANQTLAQITEITTKIKSGEGNIGMLLNDENLYNNLLATSNKVNTLLTGINENPKKYFSIVSIDLRKKDKKKKKGETPEE